MESIKQTEHFFHKPLYFVYIAINDGASKYEVGLAGSLKVLLWQWSDNNYVTPECRHLVYHEAFTAVDDAIEKEKEIKRWSKQKLHAFITRNNPDWCCLNDSILMKT